MKRIGIFAVLVVALTLSAGAAYGQRGETGESGYARECIEQRSESKTCREGSAGYAYRWCDTHWFTDTDPRDCVTRVLAEGRRPAGVYPCPLPVRWPNECTPEEREVWLQQEREFAKERAESPPAPGPQPPVGPPDRSLESVDGTPG